MIKKFWQTLLLKNGALFFRFRNFLFPIFGVTMFFFTQPAFFLNDRMLDPFVVAIGLVLALGGMAFRLFVIGFAYIHRGGKDGKVFANELVVEGLYAHVRNPMYIGNFSIIVGLGLIYGSPWVYFILIPFFAFIYLSIVVTEENYLRGRFGTEFDAYCSKVNRFIPDFSGIKQTLSGSSYNWKKAIRKEYGTTVGVLVGCYVLWLRKQHTCYGFNLNTHHLLPILAPFVVIGTGYFIARYLKLSGKLKTNT